VVEPMRRLNGGLPRVRICCRVLIAMLPLCPHAACGSSSKSTVLTSTVARPEDTPTRSRCRPGCHEDRRGVWREGLRADLGVLKAAVQESGAGHGVDDGHACPARSPRQPAELDVEWAARALRLPASELRAARAEYAHAGGEGRDALRRQEFARPRSGGEN
jgi:hypothetical protein